MGSGMTDDGCYPWDGPDDDVIAADDTQLDAGPTATMVASNDRTNYVRVQNHGLYTDEPPGLSHSFKKGGRGEAPSSFGYLVTAGMSCEVNTLEQMLHKARISTYEIDAECTGFSYTEGNIKRVQRLDLALTLTVHPDMESRAERCLEVFEKGCAIGETLKRGMDFRVDKHLIFDESLE